METYKKGLVSIGLPVYNGAATDRLPRSLDSLLNQTYHNIEITLSDNASTDGTEKICREYAARDSRIRYIRQKKNITSVPNIEFVMHNARGEYSMLAADDDWWHPQFVERLKKVLDANSLHGIAMCSVQRVSQHGELLGEVLNVGTHDLTRQSYGEVFDKISHRGLIHFILGLYRTELLHGLLRQPFPVCIRPDRVFLCEAAFATKMYSLPDVLYHRTIHDMPAIERYGDEPVWAAYGDPKAHIKFVSSVVSRLIRSRNVPLGRKLALYPFHFLYFFWRWRNALLREIV